MLNKTYLIGHIIKVPIYHVTYLIFVFDFGSDAKSENLIENYSENCYGRLQQATNRTFHTPTPCTSMQSKTTKRNKYRYKTQEIPAV